MTSNITQTWQHAKNILCIRLDHVGDVLMASPAMRALKAALPDCRLSLLAAPHASQVGAHIPLLDDVIEYAAPWMKSSAQHAPDIDSAMIARLRERQFDAAVIFTTYSQSPLPAALMCVLAGIPLRLAHCHENPYRLLSDWVPDPEPQQSIRHEVRRQLDLVAAIGARTDDERLLFSPREQDRAWAEDYLRQQQLLESRRWLILHPGASAPSRRYPATLWAQVAASLARQGFSLLLTGSAQESVLVDSVRSMMGCEASDASAHSLAGMLDLGQLGALLSHAPLLIVGNTGPAHLAAAVGTPVVDVYALTNPQHTPWRVPSRVLFHDVPCRNCYKSICPQGHHACLQQLAPERVVAAALELLQTDEHVNAEAGSALAAAPAHEQLPTPEVNKESEWRDKLPLVGF